MNIRHAWIYDQIYTEIYDMCLYEAEPPFRCFSGVKYVELFTLPTVIKYHLVHPGGILRKDISWTLFIITIVWIFILYCSNIINDSYEIWASLSTCIFLVLVLVVRCYTCSFLNSATPFPDLNPISLFGTILHAFLTTSFTTFLTVNVANSLHRWNGPTSISDRFAEHLRSVRNNYVDKPVARHFNAHFWW